MKSVPVFVVDLTSSENTPKNKIRVCELDSRKLQLTFRWIPEMHLLKKEMGDIDKHQIDDHHVVLCDLEGENDQRNCTADLFGIRAFGDCYGCDSQGGHCLRNFPNTLRRWYYALNERSTETQPHHADMEYQEWMATRPFEREENQISSEEEEIQFIYHDVGFTSTMASTILAGAPSFTPDSRLPSIFSRRYYTSSLENWPTTTGLTTPTSRQHRVRESSMTRASTRQNDMSDEHIRDMRELRELSIELFGDISFDHTRDH